MAARFLPGHALVTGLALAGSATSAASGLDGAWCHPEWGGALFWEERSLGLGEHRICDWETAPDGRNSFATKIHCRSIYLNGEEVVETDHKSHRFSARRMSADRLQIQFDEDAPITLTRCPH